MKKVLSFTCTSDLVIELLKRDLSKIDVKVEIKKHGLVNSGSITLISDTQNSLDNAIDYINNHQIYKYNFTV